MNFKLPCKRGLRNVEVARGSEEGGKNKEWKKISVLPSVPPSVPPNGGNTKTFDISYFHPSVPPVPPKKHVFFFFGVFFGVGKTFKLKCNSGGNKGNTIVKARNRAVFPVPPERGNKGRTGEQKTKMESRN